MSESIDAWRTQRHLPERDWNFAEDEDEQRELLERFKRSYGQIRDLDQDDIYFDEAAYEAQNDVEDYLGKLGLLAHKYLRHEEYSNVINVGREVLQILGIPGAEQASSQSESSAVALTEAINLAAKNHTYGCYALKPAMIVAAWKLGADFGIGEDNAYYLGTPTVGVASFHDPEDEVGYLVLKVLNEQMPIWESPWSGVPRQEDAHDLLQDLNAGGSLVEQYANATSTEEMRKIREMYMQTNRAAATSRIAELLSNLEKSKD